MAKKKSKVASERVVISRVDPFIAGHSERIYTIGPPDGRRNHASTHTTDIDMATQFDRGVAEKLLARGRWHGLDPQLEEAPNAVA